MQKLRRFWKKDFINKAIVLAVCLIVAVLVVDLVILLMPKSSGNTLLNDLFPTPTLAPEVILTSNAATASYEAAMATASVPPTMTTMPLVTFTPLIKSPTATQATTPTPSNQTPDATLTPIQTQTLSLPEGMACIPGNQREYGKAIEIIDGNTIKVLINGLVYQVRYIGVRLPEDTNAALLTAAKNGELVYLKDLTLIGDGADKDQVGRLLRYVMAEDQFINLELIQQGYAYADAAEPLSSCGQVFKDAEQAAQAAKSGIWKFIPATPAP
jgi:micrococcal nuclease